MSLIWAGSARTILVILLSLLAMATQGQSASGAFAALEHAYAELNDACGALGLIDFRKRC